MQSLALSYSPSSPFLKPTNLVTQNPTCLRPIRLVHSSSLFPVNLSSICRKRLLCSASPPVSGRRHATFKVRASAAVPESAADSGSLVGTLQLGSLFGFWYLVNIYFNIYNKQVLKVFPFPATVTAFQFGCGTVTVLLMWALNLYKKPKITRSQIAPIMFLALAHAAGNFLTNVSIGRVALSFTHTIKAMEPFFAVVLAVLFLGERPNLWVVSSLVPIAGGVALASFSESSFNWIGFYSAMASNVTNQSRNVFSKKYMVNKEDCLDNINLFSVLTIISFVLLVPVAIISEGVRFSPSYLQNAASQGLNLGELCVRSLVAGLCFHSYQQISFTILHKVSPVTHSVGNCAKRVVVIVASIVIFRTPVSPVNSLGTALALAGVFLYTKVKRIKPEARLFDLDIIGKRLRVCKLTIILSYFFSVWSNISKSQFCSHLLYVR